MSQPKGDFLYYVVNDQGQSATTDTTGNVVFSAAPTPLDDTPEGWQENAIKWIRNPSLSGVFRSMTAPFTFRKQGAKILRYFSWVLGFQAFAKLLIQRRNNDNIYEDLYAGNIDLTKVADVSGGVTTEILEAGLSEMFTANRGTTYEIPVNVPEALNVTMDGIILFSNVNLAVYADTILNIENEPIPNIHYSGSLNIGSFVENGETTMPSLIFNQQVSYLEGGNAIVPKDIWPNDWKFYASQTTHLEFSTTLRASAATSLWFIRMYIYNENTGTTRSINLATGSAGGSPVDLIIPISFSGDLQTGEKAWIYWEMDVSGDAEFVSFGHFPLLDNDTINLTYTFRKDASNVKMLRALYVFNWLVKKITGNVYSGTSDLLQNQAFNFVVTCGDALRGIEDAAIKTSLDDFMTSYNVRFNTGVGQVPTGLRMEGKRHFYNNNTLAPLGSVNTSEYAWYTEALFNKIVIGWPNQTYNDVNGRDEFNTEFEWGTSITKITKELTLISVYRGDCFGAEFARVNLTGIKSKDAESDNGVWMINVASQYFTGSVTFNNLLGNVITTFGRYQSVFPGAKITIDNTASNNGIYDVINVSQIGGFTEITVQQAVVNEAAVGVFISSDRLALNRPPYVITGVRSPETVFNVDLSVKRCLLAHGNYIRSGLYGNETTYLTLNNKDKNDKLVTTLGGVTVSEKDPVIVGSLESPLFIPVSPVFDTNVQRGFASMLLDDPYAKIPYTDRGYEWTAYILEVGESPAFNPAQRFKMVLAPGNDIKKLQNIYNG